MSDLEDVTLALRDAHKRFSSLVESLRPELHRYCSRMTGSVLDGEDLVQETLAQAFYGLPLLREGVPLRPWLFTIAHHRCVDFLRSRRISPVVDTDATESATAEEDVPVEDRVLASQAFSQRVLTLPPRERAAVILKDILGYSLPEIAAILETTVGGVKSALHRGRDKMAVDAEEPPEPEALAPEVAGYLDAFNRRDWAALLAMLEAEVRCELVGFVHHNGLAAVERNYLGTYGRLPHPWKLVPGTVDGAKAIVVLREKDGVWTPWNVVRVSFREGRIHRIRDYVHVPYMLDGANVVVVEPTHTPTKEKP